jgi:uncharacterized protein
VAELPGSIEKSVEKFLSAVRARQRVDAAYVFGSHARDAATKWSDIDVAVISSDFTADRFSERVKLMLLAASIDDRIEPSPFRPEDFDDSDPLASEIRQTGIRVA